MLVVALSLSAAFLFAAAATIQQYVTRVVASRPRSSDAVTLRALRSRVPIVFMLRELVRSPLWLVGWVTNLVGFFTQAAALKFGSVALVQPLLVTQLLFTLPMISMQARRWPQKREWFAGAAVFAGVAVFVSVRGGVTSVGAANPTRILLAVGSALGLIAILVMAAFGRSPKVRSAMFGVAAGFCFALTAVFIKLTATDLFGRGVGHTAADYPGYALAGSTALGLLLEHEAFASGPLPITTAAMTITNPVASYLIGIFAFHAAVPTAADSLASLTGSAALLIVGTAILAGSRTVRRDVELAPPEPGAVGSGTT